MSDIKVQPVANNNNTNTFQEFSPRKFILQVRSTGAYVLSKWWIIIIVAILFGLAGAATAFLKKPLYVAETTFALDDEPVSGSKNSLSKLATELGLEVNVDAGTVFSSITNIVELMQSRLLIEKTLRRTVTIDDKKLLFADFFLDSLNFREKWMKASPYYRIDFLAPKKDKNAILFENSIMRNIYDVITTQLIKIDQKGKGTTIISVTCSSEHELFSKYFLEAWLNEVTHYYIDTKTQKARDFLSFVEKRTDSVRSAYYSSLYGRAAFSDEHMNPNRQIVAVSGEKQQTDVQILKASYVELVKSLETARTSLMQETPLIQFLDVPILPLKTLKPNMIKRFLFAAIAGAFLIIVYFIMRKGYAYIISLP
jgi:hypothetical protein